MKIIQKILSKKKMTNYKLPKKKLMQYKKSLGLIKREVDTNTYYDVMSNDYNTKLNEEFKNSTRFLANSEMCILDRIQEILGVAKEQDSHIMSMREYVDGIILGKYDAGLRMKFLTLSEEHRGYDIHGLFGSKGEEVIVITHNIFSLTQEQIITIKRKEENNSEGRKQKRIYYDPECFSKLLEGKIRQKIKIPMHLFSDKRYIEYPYGMPYGIVLPYKEVCASGKGKLNLRNCLENNLLMARAGGRMDMVRQYLFKKMNLNGFGYKAGGMFYFNHDYQIGDKIPKTQASYSLLTPYKVSIFALSSFYEEGTFFLLSNKST